MLIIWKKLKETFLTATSQENSPFTCPRSPQIISEPTIQGAVHTATISVGNASNVPPNQMEAVRVWHQQLLQQGVAVGAHFTGAHVDTAQFNLLNLEAAVSTVEESKTASIIADLPSTKALTSLQTTWCFSGENQLNSVSIHIGTNLQQEDFARLGLPAQMLLLEEKCLKPVAHQQLYDQLMQHLAPVGQNTTGNRIILVGPPGLGKSYCAQHYLYHTAPEQHNMVAWLQGSSQEAFDRDWKNLADKFRWMDSELSEADDTAAIRSWCEQKLGQWLLIIDDVNIDAVYLEKCLPHRGGHVLLITRHPAYFFPKSNTQSTVKRLHFLPLNLHDSRQLVEAYFGHYWSNTGHAAEEKAFEQLCTVMGGNPFALAQAALFICKKNLSFRRFMAQFQDETTQTYLLQDRVFEELSPQQTVAYCWSDSGRCLLAALKIALPDYNTEELENNLTTFIMLLLDFRIEVPGKPLLYGVTANGFVATGIYTEQTLAIYRTYLPSYLPLSFDETDNAWHLTPLSVAVLPRLMSTSPLVPHEKEERKVVEGKVGESKIDRLLPPAPAEISVRPFEANFSLQASSEVGDISIRAYTENYQQRQDKLKGGWKLPRPNPNFIPREKLTNGLAQKLSVENKAIKQVLLTTAVAGMGGVGKTELARHFVTQHPQSQMYSYRFWLDASTPDHLYTEFRELAEHLQLIEQESHVPDSEMLARVKKWLAINSGWLLILDNADQYNMIKALIPEVGGCVLLTTRGKRPGTLLKERVVEVAVLAPEEAFDWLCQLMHRPVKMLNDTEKTAASTLVEKLGYLPLAIAQAAAYLQVNPAISIAAYLKQFDTLLGDKTHVNTVNQTDNEEERSRLVVSSTWEISLRAIKKKVSHPEIIDGLLNVCAYLAPRNIPLCILEIWLEQNWPTHLSRELSLLNYWLDEYVGQLIHYSLIDRDSQTATLSLHNLVQEVKRSQLALKEQHDQIGKTLECLIEANPQEGGKQEAEQLWRSFLAHLEMIVAYQDQTKRMEDVLLARALNQLGILYQDIGGQFAKSEELLKRGLKILETDYENNHCEISIILGNLGSIYGILGDAHRKLELLKRTLKIREAHYGAYHYEVAVTLVCLGNAYGDLGYPAQRKFLLERALKIQKAYYGPNHYQIASTLVSLGNAYGALDDVHQRWGLLACALKIEEAHYGRDHYQVASTLCNLATACEALGWWYQQRELCERALGIFETHYGKNHLKIAITLVNLSNAYDNLGHGQQQSLLERALKIEEAHYGSHHFLLAPTLTNLAIAYTGLQERQLAFKTAQRAYSILVTNSLYSLEHPRAQEVMCVLQSRCDFTLTDLCSPFDATKTEYTAYQQLKRDSKLFEEKANAVAVNESKSSVLDKDTLLKRKGQEESEESDEDELAKAISLSLVKPPSDLSAYLSCVHTSSPLTSPGSPSLFVSGVQPTSRMNHAVPVATAEVDVVASQSSKLTVANLSSAP